MRVRALSLLVLFFAMIAPALADATSDAIVALVVREGKSWKAVLVNVDIGKDRYVARMSDGARIKKLAAPHASGGVAGAWAEVAVMPLDSANKPIGQGGSWLLHDTGGKWRVVASNEGVGYPKDVLKKAAVPADVIKKLKLDVGE